MATRVRSYSKINLGLTIGPVRADGFHALTTLYQTLALHDLVTVEVLEPISQNRDMGHPASRSHPSDLSESRPSDPLLGQNLHRGLSSGILQPSAATAPAHNESRITLTTNDPRVPTDARNTAWKMIDLALSRMGLSAEVAVHIEKTLPVQGGMGAGSANAAAALIGLERELGREVPDRMALTAEVGSDVPLFLVGGAVLGTGRGEIVSPMPDLPATWCVVAVPDVGVSTPRAFQEWDGLCATSARLTSAAEPDRLKKLSHVYASAFGNLSETELASDTSGIVRGLRPETKQGGSEVQSSEPGSTLNGLAGNTLLALVRTGIENDFEQVVFPQYPLLREIKRMLMGTSAGSFQDLPASGDAIYAALSGSGSALFGLYRTEADAKAAQRRVQAGGCKAILTETLPREEYWRKMFAE